MVSRTMTIGSLEVGVYDNGLIRLRLLSLRKGEPVSILSLENLEEIIAFVQAEEDDEELEDVLG